MRIVTIAELARHLNRDPKAVRVAVENGRLTRRADGRFDLEEALKQWAETTQHERGHNNRSAPAPGAEVPAAELPSLGAEAKSTDYAKARAGTQVYVALTKKLEYERKVGTLTPTIDVERARFTEFRILRDACFNIPSRLAADLAGVSDVERCQQILEGELTAVFNAFAEGKLS